MADIDLERKSSPAIWPWLLGIGLVALAFWIGTEALDDEPDYAVAEMEEAELPVRTTQPTTDMAAAVPLSEIRANPSSWIGRAFPDGEVMVGSVPTDRGFWIEENGTQLFALLIDGPREVPVDINAGQTLRIEGGMFRAPSYLSEVAGTSIDDDTRQIVEGLDIMLVVDEDGLEVIGTDNTDM